MSKISNEMLKHMGDSIKKITLKLANIYMQVSDIPEEWRHALLYPIPKTMDWEYSLTKTRPIILLETLRKVVVKIITKRLSKIIADHNILKGGNHAGLPGGSTEAPLRIINTCIEDTKKNNKEIWLTFQDLSKAYDRVDIKMLKLALRRIKIPEILCSLIVNLFTNSKKSIIKDKGITE